MEKGSEDDKQKLREGKISISKVYQEIADSERPKEPIEEPEVKMVSERDLRNMAELSALVERLLEEDLYCPECGSRMFECGQCHKTLKELLQSMKSIQARKS